MWTDRQREIIRNTNYHVRNDGGVVHAEGNVLVSIALRFKKNKISEKEALQLVRAYNFAIKKFKGKTVSLEQLVLGDY